MSRNGLVVFCVKKTGNPAYLFQISFNEGFFSNSCDDISEVLLVLGIVDLGEVNFARELNDDLGLQSVIVAGCKLVSALDLLEGDQVGSVS